ncbi:hypothetical protein BGX20_007473, partial [Mortierella sp. AD010]
IQFGISAAGQGQVALRMPLPKGMKFVLHSSCPSRTLTQAPGLEHVLSTSLYATLLQRQRHIELDSGICELFNRDWEFSPHFRFTCTRTLAGCLLLNSQSGQAIIANTIESYGWTRLVNTHHKPFVVRKSQPVANSATIDQNPVQERLAYNCFSTGWMKQFTTPLTQPATSAPPR